MDRSTVIYLVKETYVQDRFGVERVNRTRRKIFANVTSVSSSEWFEGGRHGLNPEYRMIIFGPEYHGEKIIEYKNQNFSVYRTYQAKDDMLELYVERKQGDVRNGQEQSQGQ